MNIPSDIIVRCYLIPPENIAGFKFLIESYEGLAIMRTLDPKLGYELALVLPESIELFDALIESIKEEFNLFPTSLPDNPGEDWLFKAEV